MHVPRATGIILIATPAVFPAGIFTTGPNWDSLFVTVHTEVFDDEGAKKTSSSGAIGAESRIDVSAAPPASSEIFDEDVTMLLALPTVTLIRRVLRTESWRKHSASVSATTLFAALDAS
jgi:hypothetical protein